VLELAWVLGVVKMVAVRLMLLLMVLKCSSSAGRLVRRVRVVVVGEVVVPVRDAERLLPVVAAATLVRDDATGRWIAVASAAVVDDDLSTAVAVVLSDAPFRKVLHVRAATVFARSATFCLPPFCLFASSEADFVPFFLQGQMDVFASRQVPSAAQALIIGTTLPSQPKSARRGLWIFGGV